jgi:hypothetical protein
MHLPRRAPRWHFGGAQGRGGSWDGLRAAWTVAASWGVQKYGLVGKWIGPGGSRGAPKRRVRKGLRALQEAFRGSRRPGAVSKARMASERLVGFACGAADSRGRRARPERLPSAPAVLFAPTPYRPPLGDGERARPSRATPAEPQIQTSPSSYRVGVSGYRSGPGTEQRTGGRSGCGGIGKWAREPVLARAIRKVCPIHQALPPGEPTWE